MAVLGPILMIREKKLKRSFPGRKSGSLSALEHQGQGEGQGKH